MILVVNICCEKLHYYEFVKPIEDILKEKKIDYFTRHYKDVKGGDLMNCEKVIICGTSLKDNEFVQNINCFLWVKDYKGSVLGICGGMQAIGLVYDLERQAKELDIKNDFSHILKKCTEIGYYSEEFSDSFFGLLDEEEVYHLHNYYIDFSKMDNFRVFSQIDKVSQAVMHNERNIYGVLFHPEVRNKDMIIEFVKNE